MYIKTINTTIGELSIHENADNFPNGLVIKLNNAPIVRIEESNNKLVIKRYSNKNTIYDDDYINLKPYDVEDLDIDTINEILKDIEEDIQ